jgi:hypothetical protein
MSNKIGRNDDCPCGSGKKYKKCCGANTGVRKKIKATVIKDSSKIMPAINGHNQTKSDAPSQETATT